MVEEQPIQSTQPEVPVSKPCCLSSSWKIVSFLLLGLLALVIAVFAGIQIGKSQKSQVLAPPTTPTITPTPTTDLTASWKTYSTSTYRLQYPSDMTVDEGEASTLVLSKWGPTQKGETELYDGILLGFQPFELPNINLESYVQGKIDYIKMAEIEVSGQSPTSIGNYTGLTYTAYGGNGLGTRYIYLQSSGKIMIVEIEDSTNDPTNQGFQQTADKIISTFEFIE